MTGGRASRRVRPGDWAEFKDFSLRRRLYPESYVEVGSDCTTYWNKHAGWGQLAQVDQKSCPGVCSFIGSSGFLKPRGCLVLGFRAAVARLGGASELFYFCFPPPGSLSGCSGFLKPRECLILGFHAAVARLVGGSELFCLFSASMLPRRVLWISEAERVSCSRLSRCCGPARSSFGTFFSPLPGSLSGCSGFLNPRGCLVLGFHAAVARLGGAS